MVKRKQEADGGDSDGDSSDVSLVNVDFEFFDPNPATDFHALKRLLDQLFQADANVFRTHDLAELILSQPFIGSTVKTDGIESDPYAFLTVLNMHIHQEHPSIKALTDYVFLKASSDPPFQSALQGLLGPEGLKSKNHVGFIFCERLINMPVQVIPPMYRMLADEIKWALDDNKSFIFSHLLFISRIYKLSPDEEINMQATNRTAKRQKSDTADASSSDGVYSFHAEDEYIQKVASFSLDYSFTTSPPRDKDSFGLDTGGRMMLVPTSRLTEIMSTINDAFRAPL